MLLQARTDNFEKIKKLVTNSSKVLLSKASVLSVVYAFELRPCLRSTLLSYRLREKPGRVQPSKIGGGKWSA